MCKAISAILIAAYLSLYCPVIAIDSGRASKAKSSQLGALAQTAEPIKGLLPAKPIADPIGEKSNALTPTRILQGGVSDGYDIPGLAHQAAVELNQAILDAVRGSRTEQPVIRKLNEIDRRLIDYGISDEQKKEFVQRLFGEIDKRNIPLIFEIANELFERMANKDQLLQKCQIDKFVSDNQQGTVLKASLAELQREFPNLGRGRPCVCDVPMVSRDDLNKGERSMLAHNSDTPPDVLRMLANDKDFIVKYNVAANPSTPLDVLRQLAVDDSDSISCQVARNPSTPPDLLRQLADDDTWVRGVVKASKNTPPDVLQKLQADEEKWGPEHIFSRAAKDSKFQKKRKGK